LSLVSAIRGTKLKVNGSTPVDIV